jgi:8-oxo-dGTP pyrophosphatase MutT (NUDIX family)
VTVHGGLEEGETFEDALLRETRQEVGAQAGRLLAKNVKTLYEVTRVETPEKVVVTYATILPPDFVVKMQLNASTGGIRLVGQEELNNIIELTDKEEVAGVPDDLVAMFSDEIQAVKGAFNLIGQAKVKPVPRVEAVAAL